MQTIRVLLVDDEQDLLVASKIYLENIEKNFHIYTAACANDALDILKKEPIDVIVSDYQMPEINGLVFLERIRELGYDIPFIIFTGRGREEVVIQALNLGADYYLQKGGDVQSQFHVLINLINKSIDKKKAEIVLRKSEEKFSKAFQYSFNSIAINRRSDTEFLDVNDNFLQMLNYSRDEVVGKTSYELMIWAKKEDYNHYRKQILETGELNDFETILLTKDARLIPVLISATLIDIEGELCVLSVSRDISELTQALESLKENELRYRLLFEESPIALFHLNLFKMKAQIDALVNSGVNDVIKYLEDNPELLTKITKAIKIDELNKTAYELMGTESKEDIPMFFDVEFIMKNKELFLSFPKFILSKEPFYEEEFNTINFKGVDARIFIRMSLATGSKESWSKLYVSIINLTGK